MKWSRSTLAIVAALAAICTPHVAIAGSGQVIVTPSGTVRKSGLRLSVDTQWVDASGYRNVRINLATLNGAPSASQRELEIELSPNSYGNQGNFIVRQTIVLPQGAIQAATEMLVPQAQPWHYVAIRVFEDGSFLEELSSETSMSNVADEWSETIPTILVIDTKAPTTSERSGTLTRANFTSPSPSRELADIRGLEMLVKRGAFHPQSEGPQPPDIELLRRVSSTSRLELLPPRGLSDRWLALTCFDLVIVSNGDLQQLATQQPPQFEAMLNWLHAGGNLIVYDLGEKYERLTALENTLKISPVTQGDKFLAAGWKSANPRDFNDDTTRVFQSMQNYGSYYPSEEGESPPATVTPFREAFGAGNGPKMLTRRAGMGLVVALAIDDPFPGSSTEWSWLLNTVTSERYMWYLRQGLSLRRENDDYWDLLVPRTGMAPVWEFCVLITLFALIIGPVNYFVLFRQKRLYLLLATIPLGAAIVTFGLIFYAVVSDGLGTRTRVRSYTHLDQTAGRAASWSRQSYYAGLAPSQGLSFPSDAAVYVSEQYPSHEYASGFRRQRTLVWDEQQNLRKGYMSSRVTSQFLTQSSGQTAAAIRFDQVIAPKNAQNGLGGAVALILVRDKAGDYFLAADVPPSGQFALSPIKFDDARIQLKKLFADNRLAQPPGLDSSQFNNWYGRWYGGWGIDNSQPAPKMGTSLMEQQLRRLQTANNDTLAPGSYVAILTTLGEIPMGIAGAKEEASFHVVEGKF